MPLIFSSTFRCNKCDECFRVSNYDEFKVLWDEHKQTCDGEFENVWKNRDKMTDKEREELGKKVLFRRGKLGKFKDLRTDDLEERAKKFAKEVEKQMYKEAIAG